MPVRLILHADDFGLTPGINRGIAELARAGAISSASLMVTAPAAEEAAELSKILPRFGAGCHLVLVDGSPASPAASVPSLLAPDGYAFRASVREFARAWLRGAIRPAEVAREIEAQICRMRELGLQTTHVDTHKHLHALPGLARIVLRVARDCGVRAVRLPFEPAWASKVSAAPWVRRFQMRSLRRLERSFRGLPELRNGEVLTTGGTLGMTATGTLDERTLRSLLAAALAQGGDEAWELCCHPGYPDDDLAHVRTRLRASRETELRALLAVVPEVRQRTEAALRVIHYGDLLPPYKGVR